MRIASNQDPKNCAEMYKRLKEAKIRYQEDKEEEREIEKIRKLKEEILEHDRLEEEARKLREEKEEIRRFLEQKKEEFSSQVGATIPALAPQWWRRDATIVAL